MNYISNLKDPFSDTDYKTAQVVITEATGGKFEYAVTLEGSEYEFDGVSEKNISKDELD